MASGSLECIDLPGGESIVPSDGVPKDFRELKMRLNEEGLEWNALRGISATSASDELPKPLWGLDRIDQNNSSDGTNPTFVAVGSGENTSVYVVDSGVEPLELVFGDRVAEPITIQGCLPALTCTPHGTQVASLIGGRTKDTPTGLATSATIVPVNVTDQGGTCVSYISAGLAKIAQRELHGDGAIVNVSIKLAKKDVAKDWPWWSEILNRQISHLSSLGVITVVAAGDTHRPCHKSGNLFMDFRDLNSAIRVGSIDYTDQAVPLCSKGLDIFAPGVNIGVTFDAQGKLYTTGGASFAAAFVSGALAVDLSNSRHHERLVGRSERATLLKMRLDKRATTPTRNKILCARGCPTQFCPPSNESETTQSVPPCPSRCCWEKRNFMPWIRHPGLRP